MKITIALCCFVLIALCLAEEADKGTSADKVESTTASKFPSFKKPDFTTRRFGFGAVPTTAAGYYPGQYDGRSYYDGRYEGRYDGRYYQPYKNNDTGFGYRPNFARDWKTVRLENKVDARGYHFTYETINGLLAEEVGYFENIGLKHEGTKVQGFVQLTGRDTNDVIFRMDYTTFHKGENPAVAQQPPAKSPPTITELLSILNAQR